MVDVVGNGDAIHIGRWHAVLSKRNPCTFVYLYLRSLLSDGFVVLELQIWPHINIRRFVLPFFKYNLERFPLPHSPLKFGNRAQGCRQFGRQPSHDLENWAGARDDTNERGSLTGFMLRGGHKTKTLLPP